MNLQMIDMQRAALSRGFEVLILTNVMRPHAAQVRTRRLAQATEAVGERLIMRVSLDLHSLEVHRKRLCQAPYWNGMAPGC